MLSRHAESLYWMARYIDRADTLARKLEVAYRISLIPSEIRSATSEFQSLLETADQVEHFNSLYSKVTESAVGEYMVYDRENPSSVLNCLRNARQNAREVRTSLTTDVWHTINKAWLEFQEIAERSPRIEVNEVCDWIKSRAAMVRGAFENTQMTVRGYDFFNLGLFIERGDSTARLLDMKYHILLPTVEMVGGGVDNYQWRTLLQAASSYRAFHWTYGGEHSPEKIAEFLILNKSCPRSLHHCTMQVHNHLSYLSDAHGRYSPAMSNAAQLHEELVSTDITKVMSSGLHEFLQDFILKNYLLGELIAESFLFREV